jgi:hypothetical protein
LTLDPEHGVRGFGQTARILSLFVERWGRAPGAREWINVDGERVMIGPWLAKARTRLNSGQLPAEQERLLADTLRPYGIDPAGH